MTCLLELDRLAPQHELAADGCLIILLIQSRISLVNNLARPRHYISPYPKTRDQMSEGARTVIGSVR